MLLPPQSGVLVNAQYTLIVNLGAHTLGKKSAEWYRQVNKDTTLDVRPNTTPNTQGKYVILFILLPTQIEAIINNSISQKSKVYIKNMIESTHREFKNSIMMFAKQWKTSI